MAVVVIKTIKGRRYRYLQSSYRVGGKVRTISRYLGPVDGPKRKKGKLDFRGAGPGLLKLGIDALRGRANPPPYRTKHRESARSLQIANKAQRELDRLYGLDRSSPERWRETYGRLGENKELLKEWFQKYHAIGRAHVAEKARQREAAPKTAEERANQDTWKRLGDLERRSREETAKAVAAREKAEAAVATPEPTAPAKDFTVDDEIEARQATFDKAVDEYNVGTEAAVDTPAPDDAPTAEPDFASGASPDGQGQQGGPGSDAGPSSSGGQK
jgi:hypothetical protein